MNGRPFYETERDRARERAIADQVERVWNCRFVQNKPAFAADLCAVQENRVAALAEVRERPKHTLAELDAWGGVFFSLQKLANIRIMADLSGLPFVFILKDRSGALYHFTTHNFEHDGVVIDGRTDRNDRHDIEPLALLRARRFRCIG